MSEHQINKLSQKLTSLISIVALILWIQTPLFAANLTNETQCEIIREALYSESPAKQFLLLEKRKIDLNQLCDYPWGGSFAAFPPLVYAVRTLGFSTIKAIVESGADANLPDEYGMTPIMAARDLATVQFLLKSRVDVNRQDENGWTPLMWHATSGSNEAIQIIKELMRAGAKRNIRNKEGKTAAELAGDNELRRLLIS